MDLNEIGTLLRNLRKAKGLTQKEVANRLGLLPKTVSKWETGRGFPDVSILSQYADVLGVSERVLLSGGLGEHPPDAGNLNRTKFYVCPSCGSFLMGMGNGEVICCGKISKGLTAAPSDSAHAPCVSEVENDYYISFPHEMTKEHYLSFVSYLRFDRWHTVKLYPEQDASVRIPKMGGGKLYYYCNRHGLFSYDLKSRRKP